MSGVGEQTMTIRHEQGRIDDEKSMMANQMYLMGLVRGGKEGRKVLGLPLEEERSVAHGGLFSFLSFENHALPA